MPPSECEEGCRGGRKKKTNPEERWSVCSGDPPADRLKWGGVSLRRDERGSAGKAPNK